MLAIQLARTLFWDGPGSHRPEFATRYAIGTALVSLVVLIITYVSPLFSPAATILAVSDLYLSRPIAISDCLRRAWAEIGTVFAVGILNGLAVLAGMIALIIPGLYIFCRLVVCVPAALIEQRGAQESLRRSWSLTKGHAGRSFVLILLFVVISIAAGMLVGVPFGIAVIANRNNPGALQTWTALTQVSNAILSIIITPILLIATSVFYFDLRVRKEAFDLQFMMDPTSERVTPPGSGSVPSILS